MFRFLRWQSILFVLLGTSLLRSLASRVTLTPDQMRAVTPGVSAYDIKDPKDQRTKRVEANPDNLPDDDNRRWKGALWDIFKDSNVYAGASADVRRQLKDAEASEARALGRVTKGEEDGLDVSELNVLRKVHEDAKKFTATKREALGTFDRDFQDKIGFHPSRKSKETGGTLAVMSGIRHLKNHTVDGIFTKDRLGSDLFTAHQAKAITTNMQKSIWGNQNPSVPLPGSKSYKAQRTKLIDRIIKNGNFKEANIKGLRSELEGAIDGASAIRQAGQAKAKVKRVGGKAT